MKRTTYIFIGILASVLVILMAGVVYISFQKSDRDSYILTFSDKLLQTEFSGVRAVKVYASDTRHAWLEGSMATERFTPSTPSASVIFPNFSILIEDLSCPFLFTSFTILLLYSPSAAE